jgi:5-methylcytosine-specific restriction enzyme subunit McrC
MQIQLNEYKPTLGVSLSTNQRDRLRVLAPSISVSPTVGVEQKYDLTPGSFVGVVNLPDGLELVVGPKLLMDRVMFLISYAVDRGRWEQMSARFGPADNILEAIIPGFTYQVRRALGRGVLQGYRTEEEALPTVRGQWRIGDQLRDRFGIAPPVEVRYDDYTPDIEVNRLLRAAIRCLLNTRSRTDQLRWPLRALDAKLDGVQLVRYEPGRIPEVTIDRRSETYRGAIALARLVLRGASYDLTTGEIEASAFLIDMNEVFEDFVLVSLREALGVSERELVQGAKGHPMFLAVGNRIPLQPDISLWSRGECTFVGDVKYKRIRDGAPNADLYQLAAYLVATGLPAGMLIYAAGEREPRTYEVVRLGKRLVVTTVNLSAPPAALLSEIRLLAARIRHVAAPGPSRALPAQPVRV